MNKRIDLKKSFLMTGGLFLAISLHKWGLGLILSLMLGFVFILTLWLGVKWTIEN